MIMPGYIFFVKDNLTVMFSQCGVIEGRFTGREKISQAASMVKGSPCDRFN
jgi:hypothetical protein